MGDRDATLSLEPTNASKRRSQHLQTLWANLRTHKPGFTKDIFDCFDDIDTDNDGFLGLGEIDRACARFSFVGHRAAALATLRRHLDDLSRLSNDETGWENDGVTTTDLAGFDMREVADPNDELIQRVNAIYDYSVRKIDRAPSKVFLDEGEIEPQSCRQGVMGDCYFLAPLVSLALRDPGRVIAMLRRKSAARWEVAFDGAEKVVELDMPTDAEIALFAAASDGLWPVLLEKAYARIIGGSFYALLSRSDNESITAGLPGRAIEVLTGSSTDDDVLLLTDRDVTREKLRAALTKGKVVVATTRSPYGASENEFNEHGLVSGHAYSVLAYDSDTDVVTVRNPWGRTDPAFADAGGDRGTAHIALDLLDQGFERIVYEE